MAKCDARNCFCVIVRSCFNFLLPEAKYEFGTPRQNILLKYFFSSHIDGEDKASYSATAIKSHIKHYIDNEDPTKPLSDQAIAGLLQERLHIIIARRTVAKYRESLQILPTHLRKQFKSQH